MSSSNARAEWASMTVRARAAHAEHGTAKAELKGPVPGDASEPSGHGVTAKCPRASAIGFEVLAKGGSQHAHVQELLCRNSIAQWVCETGGDFGTQASA